MSPAPRAPLRLPLVQARRLALEAQGLGRPRPARAARRADLLAALDRVRLLQIDSVNVLARAHYLPLFSRVGAYDRGVLDALVYEERSWFEHWGHAASLLPVRYHPILRWRMERHPWPGIEELARARPAFVEEVARRVGAEGPVSAGALEPVARGGGSWWEWSHAKLALEWLLATGRLAVAARKGFERHYDLAERVLPPEVLALPTPPVEEAIEALLLESAAALGVGTDLDLADYFRIPPRLARPALARLRARGLLRAIEVEGWSTPAQAPADLDLSRPRRATRAPARALVSPFDPLLFDRRRVERLFEFRYRIEIYTPAARRVHGYYVLPFLMDEALRARVDLKADREGSRLLVQASHLEPGSSKVEVAGALAEELRRLAGWLGLEEIVVARRGDLAGALARAVG